jgi:hypothetical protein
MAITMRQMKIVLAEIERFQKAAARAREDLKNAIRDDVPPYPSAATGAVRRASMDLTRALADLRRSG